MGRIAWIFPGQGSQFPGMGSQIYHGYPSAREVFHRADDALGFELSRLIFQGASEELTLTSNAQPAILVVSVACARVLESEGLVPDMVAGLSLGEHSALVVAGSLTLEEAVVLTRKRGTYMQEACPPGKGGMAAVLGLACAEVEAICFDVSKHGLVIGANYNCPGQIVISGEKHAVKEACRIVVEKGGRALPLPVSAPFHCALMEPAAARLKEELKSVRVLPPKVPVYANVTGVAMSTPEEIKDALIKQITSPVLWQVAVLNMLNDGATLFVEIGPGKTLSGFGRRIDRSVPFVNFAAPSDLEGVLMSYKEVLK